MSDRDPNAHGRPDPAPEPNHRSEDAPEMLGGEMSDRNDPAELGGRGGEVTGGWRILRNSVIPLVIALIVIYVIYLVAM